VLRNSSISLASISSLERSPTRDIFSVTIGVVVTTSIFSTCVSISSTFATTGVVFVGVSFAISCES
jgi:hypothetical protein